MSDIVTQVIAKLKKDDKPQIDYKIYVDMDGVLVAFDEAVKAVDPKILKDDDLLWDYIAEQGSEFWVNLAWKKHAKELWAYLQKYNPVILSAHPNPRRGQKIVQATILGKKEWLTKQLGSEVASQAILVTRGEKQKYAQYNSILIDDLNKNVLEFEAAGGIGILHSSVSETLKKLKKLGL